MHKFGAMGSLKCIECGQIFDDKLNDCPNCGCPKSECETVCDDNPKDSIANEVKEYSNNYQNEAPNYESSVSEPKNVLKCNDLTVNDLLNTDWANKVYECGALYWDTLTKRYFKFSGRASRLEFWNFHILLFLMTLPTIWMEFTETSIITIIAVLVLLISVIPYLAVCIRRLHDIDRSGWWIFVPIASFFFMFKKSDAGSNSYGEPSTITL